MGFDKPFLDIYEWQLEHLMTTALRALSSVLHAPDWWLNVELRALKKKENVRLNAYDSTIIPNFTGFVHNQSFFFAFF
jgi:hypothetical protein